MKKKPPSFHCWAWDPDASQGKHVRLVVEREQPTIVRIGRELMTTDDEDARVAKVFSSVHVSTASVRFLVEALRDAGDLRGEELKMVEELRQLRLERADIQRTLDMVTSHVNKLSRIRTILGG